MSKKPTQKVSVRLDRPIKRRGVVIPKGATIDVRPDQAERLRSKAPAADAGKPAADAATRES